MALRKIKVASLEGSPVGVYYNSEFSEYVVKIKGRPDDDYFTDDKTDALQTAQHMRNNAILTPKKNPARRKNPYPKKRDPTYWVIIKHDGYLSFRSDSGYTGSTPYDALPGSTISQKVNAFIKQLGIKRGQYEILDENPAPPHKLRYEIRRGDGRIDSAYATKAQMQSVLDEIGRDGAMYGYDPATKEKFYSFAYKTKMMKNPAPRKTVTRKTNATTMDTAKEYVRRKSQITKAKPSKRLVNRRIRNLQAPVGLFPNPAPRYPGAMDVAYPSMAAFKKDAKACGYDPEKLIESNDYFVESDGHVLSAKFAPSRARKNPAPKMSRSSKKSNFPYCVERKNTENWNTSGCFKTKNEAFEYAKALAVKYPTLPIRVMEYTGGAMK